MTIREQLEAIVRALPDGASVTLSRRHLEAMLEVDVDDGRPIADLTCEEAGAGLGRAASTIRTWCSDGRIPGAYRLHGKEWRIPRASLRRHLDAQAGREAQAVEPESVDLGRWREHRRHGG